MKHLKLSPEGEGWRLPDDADLDALGEQILDAMIHGSTISVETRDGTLLLNGRALPACEVVEVRPARGRVR